MKLYNHQVICHLRMGALQRPKVDELLQAARSTKKQTDEMKNTRLKNNNERGRYAKDQPSKTTDGL